VDWVDFKRVCARYRRPYKELADHCQFLILHCVREYSRYREYNIAGRPEYESTAVYGAFLYYLAELESLTIEHAKKQCKHWDFEFKMIGEAIDLVQGRRAGKLKNEEFLVSVAHWSRTYYGVAYSSRVMDTAMELQRKALQDEHGY
jgi:hypothetical protein